MQVCAVYNFICYYCSNLLFVVSHVFCAVTDIVDIRSSTSRMRLEESPMTLHPHNISSNAQQLTCSLNTEPSISMDRRKISISLSTCVSNIDVFSSALSISVKKED